jgi:DNA-binding GntR family transcriptional regulator
VDPSLETQFPVGVGIEHLTSTMEMITNAGHKAGCREFGLVTGSGPTLARQQLRVDHEEQLHSIERVRTADDLPAILCRDYISAARVPTKVISQFRGDESLFLFLQRECHLKVTSARADIVPLMPSPRVAELLAVSSRKPLLELKQLHFDGEGTPFLYSENLFNSQYMDLHVRRTPVS